MLYSTLFAMTESQLAAIVAVDIDAAWMVVEESWEFPPTAVSAAWDAIEADGEAACFVAGEVTAERGLSCE